MARGTGDGFFVALCGGLALLSAASLGFLSGRGRDGGGRREGQGVGVAAVVGGVVVGGPGRRGERRRRDE